ncbi:MAG: helix-turn-helix transcriptional regulator [Burkholderiaceae bacterium]|nr:helix-turn-helix transcriptional regulator [Burkholderiaceae bacterium]
MPARGVHLQYSIEAGGQQGPDISNGLFQLLQAVHGQGSILAAAKALDASYRHVWGALKRWEELLGAPLLNWVQGQPAQLTPLAQRLLWAETRARARMAPHIEALRVELERVLAEALDGDRPALTVLASHDLALPALRGLAAAGGGLHLDLRFAGSVEALQALADGRCSVAGFHVPALPEGSLQFAAAMKPRLQPGRHKLIGCMRRSQGLMFRRGLKPAPASLADVARQGLRFINRQPGAGTRLLMEHLRQQAGLADDAIRGWDGPPEESHLAVAAAVASGVADVGPGVAAAAHHFGLDFAPLVDEDYYLVCLKDGLDEPPMQALRALLAGAAWREALAALPGYAPSPAAGQVLSLTRALPWWRFHTPRRAG